MNLKSLLLLTSLLFVAAVVDAGYFVQLKKPATLQSLLAMDDKIKVADHLRPYVRKVVSIGTFEGFSGNFTKDVIQRLRMSPLVADIVPDFGVKLCDDDADDYELEQLDEWDELDYEYQLGDHDEEFNYETQFMAPRHLARLSRRGQLPLNASVNYYYDPKHLGEGVYAYIIDTGIFKEHPDLEGRAILGADFTNEGPGDLNGHGTHVSGIIGSKTFGVAKEVTLVEVKALDRLGQGSLTTVISALEFAVNHRRENGVKGVANLSLGAIRNNILNQAIQAAVESGLLVVVAAGNSNVDACLTSPASSSFAITVGAIDDRTDTIASFSNWGECVNIFASGVLVQSLSNSDIEKPVLLSGTSMSSPSITGLSTILLGKGVPLEEISTKLIELSTDGVISRRSLLRRPFTPNRVAFNGVSKQDDEYPETDFDESKMPLEEFQPGDLHRAMDPQRVGGLKKI